MANPLNRGELFSPDIIEDLYNKVTGASALAQLSGQRPIAFNGNEFFEFNLDSHIDIVGESQPKGPGGMTITSKLIRPLKVEYSARVSDEFKYASQSKRIDVLKEFNIGYARKLAEGFDWMAIHGINPRTGQLSSLIGDNYFVKQVDQEVAYTEADPTVNIEDALALVEGSEFTADGALLAPDVTTAISKITVNGLRLYPEYMFGNVPSTLGGMRLQRSRNVSKDNDLKGLVGDFEGGFRWGVTKQIPLEVIQYGDPDNTGRDLKGHNEVLLRSETYIGWGILRPEAFAKIVGA